MNKVSLAILCGAVSIALPTAARAQSMEGFRVEGHVGYDDLPIYSPPKGKGTSGNGVLIGGGIGYDVDLGGFVIGPELNVDFSTAEATFTNIPPALNFYPTAVNGGRDIDLSLRAGVKAGDTTLLYLKAGYDNARFTATYPTGKVSYTRDGLRLGAGTEQQLGGRSYAKLEYRYTNYRSFTSFTSYADGDSRHQVVAGVGIRF